MNGAAWAPLAARLAVGGVFVLSGAMKAALPPEEFSTIIEAYRLIDSADATLFLAALLPWAEIVLGFALIFGYAARPSAAAAGALLVMFIGAIASTKLRGLELPDCGCFGFKWHPGPTQALILDAVLLACAALAYKKGPGPFSLDRWCEAPSVRRP